MEEETPENSRPGSRNEGDDKDKSTSTSEESDVGALENILSNMKAKGRYVQELWS